MDIAAVSVMNAQTRVQSGADVLLLKKAMDMDQTNSQLLLDSLVPASPDLGANIDVKA
ncbi:MAG: YjfB family protein [Negativicutes bacterium]|nr:YjfB family protein [Negativicutes bacterium]